MVIVESRNGIVYGLQVDRVIDMADVNIDEIQPVPEEGSSLEGLVTVGEPDDWCSASGNGCLATGRGERFSA
ncbi:CheW domain-containing protein [Komagataeibacter saccharivorans]|uniref:hypothetical protein n=1 Tax=Komagataeibacter saccharivorans TaxID=265959 RepID=UPI0015E0D29E|nr:hypothetical protein [Komagataeibacter saccharivorans]